MCAVVPQDFAQRKQRRSSQREKAPQIMDGGRPVPGTSRKTKKAIKSEGDPAGLLVKMHTKPNCIFQPRAFVACHGPCSSLLMLPSTESLITGAKKVQNAYKTVSSLFICILVRFNATDQDKYFTLILPVCISDVLYSPHSKAVPDSECCSSNQSGFSISRVDYLFPFCP